MNILFAASEAYPFIKTGGLGDVVHSLPLALNKLGDDVRLVLPAYRDVLAEVDSLEQLGYWDLPGIGVTHRVKVLQARHEKHDGFLYLIDVPALFDRPGNPYVHAEGYNWPDNAERFTVFSRAVARLASGIPGGDWQADVLHCHDWQTGLAPAFLNMGQPRAKTVFTIHNLAYDGHFSYQDFTDLGLPPEWWSAEHVEFYGGFSMLKAGIVFSDQVTTVSPTYAREICTPEFGYRLEGVLQGLGNRLTGILNGIDLDVWNPKTDPYLCQHYSADQPWREAKTAIKLQLLNDLNLPAKANTPLLGFIGRMVEQKGVDLIAAMLPTLFASTDAMLVVLGSGDKQYEIELQQLAERYPDRLHVHIGYSEELAHQIEAGCDLFLMPSRFEPCGLNQMYSLRYGTLPIVTFTGGLADTVTDTNATTLIDKTATGFVFSDITAEALLTATKRALLVYRKAKPWLQICNTAMRQKLGWETSALEYQKLYRQ